MNEIADPRYFRWRTAVNMPIWVVDRHWYSLMGALYLELFPGLAIVPSPDLASLFSWDHRSPG